MAKCDQGYLCEVCGEPVDEMTDSDLYLRFVIGEIDADALLKTPERHIRCNPVQAQFIVDDNFEPVVAAGAFDKHDLDAEYVREQEELISRGWRRLQEVAGMGIAITEYPLEEVLARRS